MWLSSCHVMVMWWSCDVVLGLRLLLCICRYHGKQSLQTALTHHLIARVQSFLGDFRAALQHEKATYSIYHKKVSDCTRVVTQMELTQFSWHRVTCLSSCSLVLNMSERRRAHPVCRGSPRKPSPCRRRYYCLCVCLYHALYWPSLSCHCRFMKWQERDALGWMWV